MITFLDTAFLRSPAYYQAFLLCLRTIEQNDPLLLIQIDPKLVSEEVERETIDFPTGFFMEY